MRKPYKDTSGLRMQAYFDRDDAQLELQSIVTRSHSKSDAYTVDQSRESPGRQAIGLAGFALALGLTVVLIAAHLGSAMPAKILAAEKKMAESSFVIEIPPKVKPKPKPKPEIVPPKPEVVKRLRSVPDSRRTEIRPMTEPKERKALSENDRSAAEESMAKRAMPAVETPMIAENLDVQERDAATETLRYAVVSDFADTVGGFVNVVPESDSRSLPQERGASRIKLDPYHYRMVSLCLRLCVKSMFTHSGMSRSELNSSSDWLRVNHGPDEHFAYLYMGTWAQFEVNSAYITDISNLDFVLIPHGTYSGEEVNLMLEEVTRRLCKLLGYDDCFEKL